MRCTYRSGCFRPHVGEESLTLSWLQLQTVTVNKQGTVEWGFRASRYVGMVSDNPTSKIKQSPKTTSQPVAAPQNCGSAIRWVLVFQRLSSMRLPAELLCRQRRLSARNSTNPTPLSGKMSRLLTSSTDDGATMRRKIVLMRTLQVRHALSELVKLLLMEFKHRPHLIRLRHMGWISYHLITYHLFIFCMFVYSQDI